MIIILSLVWPVGIVVELTNERVGPPLCLHLNRVLNDGYPLVPYD